MKIGQQLDKGPIQAVKYLGSEVLINESNTAYVLTGVIVMIILVTIYNCMHQSEPEWPGEVVIGGKTLISLISFECVLLESDVLKWKHGST